MQNKVYLDESKYMDSLTAITWTNVVFPEHCSPTRVSSISSDQNLLLIQSNIRLINANILNRYRILSRSVLTNKRLGKISEVKTFSLTGT